MRFLDEYRDGETAGKLADAIRRAVTRPWCIMEVCGGQTQPIVKYGIDRLLQAEIDLGHGPGCAGGAAKVEWGGRCRGFWGRRSCTASRPHVRPCARRGWRTIQHCAGRSGSRTLVHQIRPHHGA